MASDPDYAAELCSIPSALLEAGVQFMVLRDIGASTDGADHTLQVLVRHSQLAAALRVVEPLGWRYSWVRGGRLRLVPMASYWWDGGPEIELYWNLPAAPLPPFALRRLTRLLWQTATADERGLLRPDPAARLAHLAVQASRPGRTHEDDWRQFLALRSTIADLVPAHAVARAGGVDRGLRRALAAADSDGRRPGPGPVYDGVLDIGARVAGLAQAHARPRSLRRLLAGTPWFGDAAIRCRISGTEVVADAGVFVPSADADLVVSEATRLLEGVARPTVVEIGTGCGAIALALARARPDAVLTGSELSPVAVRNAQRNADRLGLGRVRFVTGSLLDPLRDELQARVDLLIANLPYFPAEDYAAIGSMPRGTIQGSGEDGLGLIRELVRGAPRFLRPGGSLLLQMFAWQWDLLGPELLALGFRPGTPRLTGQFAICPAVYTGEP